MNKVDWEKICEDFEKEMASKLQDLPGHRDTPEELKKLRHLISHQIPETAPVQIFEELINLLLEEKPVNLSEIKDKYLNPQLEEEERILGKFKNEFEKLKKSAMRWIKVNLSENDLKLLWQEHRTWLPRRYTIYKDKKVSLQKIAADTLARYTLIKIMAVRRNKNS